MITEVKDAFKVRLEEKDWLDNVTKERCVEKVDAITQMVAYPDQIDNDTYLNDMYAEVSEKYYTKFCHGKHGSLHGYKLYNAYFTILPSYYLLPKNLTHRCT